ncbi:hypothetical protein [Microcoleus sp. PH2017_05_CCC_O_A]|uniref:hypothetical protein n=1 Tax=Microcoleus sp. PH2017_05_CCC_O_A TaxID=2798816 RepID=UPI001DA6A365|nr:hypothetical protein [Microcoleus sp. PH2017_05_CCC_O_A]MCC3436922.1 hypothetical protein [Microcoleus sp. PH2017_05_CCC_O_A]TAG59222.1 MAG: hypothetical protein EAZ28_12100 [Oscillatoriales cyanobacterium]
MTLVVGNLFSCSIYIALSTSDNLLLIKVSENLRSLFNNVGLCFTDTQIPPPTRQQVFEVISKLRTLSNEDLISIEISNSSYALVGFKNQDAEYFLSIQYIIDILSEYQNNNSSDSLILIIKNTKSQQHFPIKSTVEEITPALVNSVNQGYYVTKKR